MEEYLEVHFRFISVKGYFLPLWGIHLPQTPHAVFTVIIHYSIYVSSLKLLYIMHIVIQQVCITMCLWLSVVAVVIARGRDRPWYSH